jgi:hypothetical protein
MPCTAAQHKRVEREECKRYILSNSNTIKRSEARYFPRFLSTSLVRVLVSLEVVEPAERGPNGMPAQDARG